MCWLNKSRVVTNVDSACQDMQVKAVSVNRTFLWPIALHICGESRKITRFSRVATSGEWSGQHRVAHFN